MDIDIQTVTDQAISLLEQKKTELAAEYNQKMGDLNRAILHLKKDPSTLMVRTKASPAAALVPVGTKQCTKCKKDKPLAEFNKVKKDGDKLYSKCRECEQKKAAKDRARKRRKGECLRCELPVVIDKDGNKKDYCVKHLKARKVYDANRRKNKI